MVGNNIIHLTWSRPSDVFAEVPGFPAENLRVFDAGLRFLFARASALGRYQSLFSIKVQQAQNRLTHAPSSPQNRFGMVGDMGSLEERLRVRAIDRLSAALGSAPSERIGLWARLLVDLLRSRGLPFVLVELPMPKAYRQTVTASSVAVAFRRWLALDLAARGATYVDLGDPTWISDPLFADALHLNELGAEKLSTSLGQRLATLQAAHAPP
jgi:hypothetical protein